MIPEQENNIFDSKLSVAFQRFAQNKPKNKNRKNLTNRANFVELQTISIWPSAAKKVPLVSVH